MVSISFQYPQYLLFLLLIPLYIFIHLATLKANRRTALRFANFEAIARIKGVDFFSKNIIILILSCIITFFLAMAVSGFTLHSVREASAYSFVLAIDSSKSMEANDLLPNRMEAAKRVAVEFVDNLPLTTRMAVISFSGNALIEQGVTDSKSLAKNAIKEIDISEIAGTDLVEAVITGTNLLNAEESKAIILLSDGQINVGGIDGAIKYANENNIVIHSVAIGTAEGGAASFGFSKLDEDSLQSLSYNTDGEFFKAENERALLDSLYSAVKATKRKVSLNLSQYFLMAAIILFGVEYILMSSRYRNLI